MDQNQDNQAPGTDATAETNGTDETVGNEESVGAAETGGTVNATDEGDSKKYQSYLKYDLAPRSIYIRKNKLSRSVSPIFKVLNDLEFMQYEYLLQKTCLRGVSIWKCIHH